MINILFIAFEFPPLSLGGVHRPLAFVKYLPQFGINPIVITLDEGSYPDVFGSYGYDASLGKAVRESATLVNVAADRSAPLTGIRQFCTIYFSIHGNEVRQWKRPFYETVDKLMREQDIKAVFATIPPFSVLPLARKIADKYNLPLILDFRDAWSQWRTVPYGTILHYFRTLQLEKRYIRKADAVVATSRQTIDDFKRLHPAVPEEKLYYIPNGYNGELGTWKPIDPAGKTFTIGYVGSFYYTPQARAQMLSPWWRKKGHRMLQYVPTKQDWLYRSPYFFFKALKELKRTDPVLGAKITVKFAGKKAPWLAEMIASFQLEDQVFMIGEITHDQSLLFQQECDALLITSAKQLGGKDYSIAGKTFEYLQMQRPIIGFVCEGAQKELLKEAGTALICEPDDTERSAQALANLFNGAVALTPDYGFLHTLSREKLTGKLADIIRNQIHTA